MKYRSYFVPALLAGLVLTGCSNDVPEPSADADNFGGTSYVNISINLPTVGIGDTRAGAQENDQFDDGLTSEYAVKTAHLVVFKTTGEDIEDNATVTAVYDLTGLKPWNIDDNDNITASAQMVQEIQQAPADNLWMLVVLNDPDVKEHFKVNKTTFSDLTTGALSDVTFNSTDNGFFMANAPIYDATTGKAQTLVKLNKNRIYSTAAAAQTAPAIDVYVERGVSKVTVTTPSTDQELDINGEKYTVSIDAWGLDITNKSTYLLRNIDSFADWKTLGTRFYSEASQRVYWAVDPNYSSYTANSDFNRINNAALNLTTGDCAYCLENTFDVSNMRQDGTTRVVFRASFKKAGATSPSTFYTVGTSSAIYDKDLLQTLVKGECMKLFSDMTDEALFSFAEKTSVSETAGDHTIESGDVAYNSTDLTAEQLSKLNDAIGTIHTYLGGVCYYVARIQHFGETYTPWIPGSLTYGETDVDKKYLGRYGMVRNNWYELAVSKVTGLGNPEIPTPTPTPDDENHYFISFKVNIHSWAKRVQTVEL